MMTENKQKIFCGVLGGFFVLLFIGGLGMLSASNTTENNKIDDTSYYSISDGKDLMVGVVNEIMSVDDMNYYFVDSDKEVYDKNNKIVNYTLSWSCVMTQKSIPSNDVFVCNISYTIYDYKGYDLRLDYNKVIKYKL